ATAALDRHDVRATEDEAQVVVVVPAQLPQHVVGIEAAGGGNVQREHRTGADRTAACAPLATSGTRASHQHGAPAPGGAERRIANGDPAVDEVLVVVRRVGQLAQVPQ